MDHNPERMGGGGISRAKTGGRLTRQEASDAVRFNGADEAATKLVKTVYSKTVKAKH